MRGLQFSDFHASAEFRTISVHQTVAYFNLVKFEKQLEQNCMEAKPAPPHTHLSHGMIAGAVAQILWEVESAKLTFIYIYT